MAESPTRIVTVNGRKRRPWALASQEKLLQAATDEIAAVGFERARLTEIAKRAGLTPGSVYTWFKNKEDLFRAAIEHALTKQIESNDQPPHRNFSSKRITHRGATRKLERSCSHVFASTTRCTSASS
jgi:AcrR family transcriptional regulator